MNISLYKKKTTESHHDNSLTSNIDITIKRTNCTHVIEENLIKHMKEEEEQWSHRDQGGSIERYPI